MNAFDDRDDDTSDPARIERQIEETRTHLTKTLTALEHKLSARQLTTDVFDAVRDTVMGPGDGQKAMLDLVRRNPIPATLVGVGLAWMVFGRDATETATRRPRHTHEAPDAHEALAVPSAPEPPFPEEPATPETGRRAKETRIDRLRDRAGAMMQDNPLVVGALGAVIGALIGTILPMSRRESAFLSDTQGQLIDHATEIGRDALARAGDIARHAGRAAVGVVEQELGVARPRPAGRNGEQLH